MDNLEQQYLLAAYDLAKFDPMHSFYEDEIVNHVDFEFSEPDPRDQLDSRDRFIALTQKLIKKGLIAPESKGYGLSRRTLQLTSKGLEEGEKMSDPVERNKRLRDKFLRAVYELSENRPNGLVMLPEVASILNLDPDDSNEYDQLVSLAKYTVERGYAKRQFAGFQAITLTSEGIDKVEGNAPQSQPNVSNVFNMSGSNFYQSAIGTNNTNSFNGEFNFSEIERRIREECDVEDQQEAIQLVSEMRELLAREGIVDKGFLSRWNDKLNKYGWLSNAVAGWLLNFSTQV